MRSTRVSTVERITLYILYIILSSTSSPLTSPCAGKPNIAVRAVGHVFQYGIIQLPTHHPQTPKPPQSVVLWRLLICISSPYSNFKRLHNIIIVYDDGRIHIIQIALRTAPIQDDRITLLLFTVSPANLLSQNHRPVTTDFPITH